MKNFFDFTFIICVALVVFCLLQGYFGKTLQRFTKIIFKSSNIEYLVIFLLIGLFFISNCSAIEYCIDESIDKKLMDVSGNNVNINNPNINIPGSVAKALTNIGTGAAIGGGMSAAANVIKGSALPPSVKLLASMAGGVAAGAIVVGTNAANSITQSSIKSKSSISKKDNSDSGSYTANSPIDDLESDSATIDTVMTFLASNLVLHLAILYLLFALAFLYLCNKAIKNKWEFLFIRNIFGVRFYNLFMKGLNFTSKTNQIWMLVIWIMLVLSNIGSLCFAYFLLNYIDVISEIIQSK